MKGKRIFIIAGEASGDLHAANLVAAIKKQENNVTIAGWGGDRMKAEGVDVQKHIRELAFMGFYEVIKNIRTILRNFKLCKEQITAFQPDAIIMVDYPGFNLRMAEWAHKQGIKVLYYVSPQIWAWKQNRVFKIKKTVNRVFCILPFEKEFYRKFNVDVSYVGHPLLDEIQLHFAKHDSKETLTSKPVLAILPGSRKQEIERKLPVMLEAAKAFPNYEIQVACAPNLDVKMYEKYQGNSIQFVKGKTYNLLQKANLAIVTSGTATLETALFKVPQVVCYKSSPASYWIARMLVKIKYISLVNLILDKAAVKELIQIECTSENIIAELRKLEDGQAERARLIQDYESLIHVLGESGASERAAAEMLQEMEKKECDLD